MTQKIDLNADLGESYGSWSMGDDAAMLDIVTSANVACGFHGGEPRVILETVRLCQQKGVTVGAHPGFDDLRGFGRRRLPVDDIDELQAMLVYQIGALQGIAKTENVPVTHVKLHGALANMASENRELADHCVAAVTGLDSELALIAMAATPLQTAAETGGLRAVREIYADRAYNDDGTLVSRKTPGAVIQDVAHASDRVMQMLDEQAITSINGVKIATVPETICVHGDSPGAVKMADQLRSALEKAGVAVESYLSRR